MGKPMKKIRMFFRAYAVLVAAVTGLQVHSAFAASYSLVFEKSFHPGDPVSTLRGSSLAKTGHGKYLLAGTNLRGRPFVVKVSAEGRKEWEQVITDVGETQGDYTAVGDENGGTLLIGNSQDAGYAIRLGHDGEVLWKKSYPTMGQIRARGSFVCGAHIKGGFIVVGRNTAGVDANGMVGYHQLWVLKLNDHGDRDWETGILEDGPDKINPSLLRPRECSTPIVDAEGNIAFAVSVQDHRGLVIILVLKLDASGKEIARLHLDGGITPRLFSTSFGYVLLDNFNLEKKIGLRQTFVDQNMKILSQREILGSEDFNFSGVSAAWKDQRNGIHVAGGAISRKSETFGMALAYLNPEGNLVGLKTSDFGTLWQPIGMVQGDLANEVVLLIQSNKDLKLMKLRLVLEANR